MKKTLQTFTLDQLATPEVLESILAASVWKVAPVEDAPEIVLSDWQVMQLENGSRHFVGRNLTDDEGRVSSSIVAFDPVTLRGRTLSGRVYQLRGRTGLDLDGQHVWGYWTRARGIAECVDVSYVLQAEIDLLALPEARHTR